MLCQIEILTKLLESESIFPSKNSKNPTYILEIVEKTPKRGILLTPDRCIFVYKKMVYSEGTPESSHVGFVALCRCGYTLQQP